MSAMPASATVTLTLGLCEYSSSAVFLTSTMTGNRTVGTWTRRGNGRRMGHLSSSATSSMSSSGTPLGNPTRDINGRKIPVGRPQEKGIDVLCALACVREAQRSDIDLVMLATRDTDLIPALDEVYDSREQDPSRWARIETVSWFNRRWREENTQSFGSLQPTTPRRIWNTNLGRDSYEASIDRHRYR